MGLGLLGLALLAITRMNPVVLVAALWFVSVWIDMVRPRAPDQITTRPSQNIDAIARAAMEATIESINAPLVLMEGERILAANQAARGALGAHIVGQDARMALRHPDALQLLDMADGASITIQGLTGTGSKWLMTRRTLDTRHWMIALHDRTAEADVGRAHTDFVANASHELRTPLASIIGYVETMEDAPDNLDPETRKRFLGTVLREARRMVGLLSDLMSLSQLEAEKHDLPTERIDLGQLSARVVAEFAPAPGQKASRVELERPDGEAFVTGDVKQLEQLLRNLIDNALKYGNADTPVHVRLAPAPRKMIEMSVADHGAGIAPDHLPHLTRRFYRTDPGRSRAAGGTGLGLAIVKHIVERHKGKLDITSQLGVGTQVRVRLPRSSHAATAG